MMRLLYDTQSVISHSLSYSEAIQVQISQLPSYTKVAALLRPPKKCRCTMEPENGRVNLVIQGTRRSNLRDTPVHTRHITGPGFSCGSMTISSPYHLLHFSTSLHLASNEPCRPQELGLVLTEPRGRQGFVSGSQVQLQNLFFSNLR